MTNTRSTWLRERRVSGAGSFEGTAYCGEEAIAGGAWGSQCTHSQEVERVEYLCLGCFLLFVVKNDVYVCAVRTHGGLHGYMSVGTCIRVGA